MNSQQSLEHMVGHQNNYLNNSPAPHQQQHHPEHTSRRRRGSVSLSDYSDNDGANVDLEETIKDAQYQHAIEMIVRKCESLSSDNEKLIQRYAKRRFILV